jgi:hypothetical protein
MAALDGGLRTSRTLHEQRVVFVKCNESCQDSVICILSSLHERQFAKSIRVLSDAVQTLTSTELLAEPGTPCAAVSEVAMEKLYSQ